MKTFDCDLQLHGKFAGGVSKHLSIPLLAEQAKLKGLQVLSTADIQHRDWLLHVKQNLVETENGIYTDKNQQANFIIGTEVEDSHKIHHLIYLPDLQTAETFRDQIKAFGNLDCSMCGRPILRKSPAEIAQIVLDLGGILGPSHSFTPYTGLFSQYDSLSEAYGELTKKIPFLELGLSADTNFADRIKSNHEFAFLSSSDAHSAWPHRLGREFNRIELKKPGFKELKDALFERTEQKIVFNAGLNPAEGKYHATACNSCYSQFDLLTSRDQFRMTCPNCGGQIKRGVRDRILELSDTPAGKHPSFRPPYKHLLPLAEIIQQSDGTKNVLSKSVQSQWRNLVDRFGNEIKILIDTPEDELIAFDPLVGKKIVAFRNGLVFYKPGGGGQYGTPVICETEDGLKRTKNEFEAEQKQQRFSGQQSLGKWK